MMKNNTMRTKLSASILAGLLYWVFDNILLKLEIAFDIDTIWLDTVGLVILPVFVGFILYLLLKERNFGGIFYSFFITGAYYIVELIASIVRFSSVIYPFKATYKHFIILGKYSVFFLVIGGLIAISINRRMVKEKVENELNK